MPCDVFNVATCCSMLFATVLLNGDRWCYDTKLQGTVMSGEHNLSLDFCSPQKFLINHSGPQWKPFVWRRKIKLYVNIMTRLTFPWKSTFVWTFTTWTNFELARAHEGSACFVLAEKGVDGICPSGVVVRKNIKKKKMLLTDVVWCSWQLMSNAAVSFCPIAFECIKKGKNWKVMSESHRLQCCQLCVKMGGEWGTLPCCHPGLCLSLCLSTQASLGWGLRSAWISKQKNLKQIYSNNVFHSQKCLLKNINRLCLEFSVVRARSIYFILPDWLCLSAAFEMYMCLYQAVTRTCFKCQLFRGQNELWILCSALLA